MKFSESWLREFVNPPLQVEQLVEQLTMLGLEVDALEAAAPAFHGVVVGCVLESKPHPRSDKLRLCRVDAGDSASQIVCGASNVKAGGRYPLAKIGSILPGNRNIKQAELKGELSSGMLCSEAELGLSDNDIGLMELPEDAPIGSDIRDYLQLNDHVIEIDLTPNRGDCLSVLGIARELATANRLTINKPDIKPINAHLEDGISINIHAPHACPRYVGRIIRDINSATPAPLWLVERLRRSGIRSIHPVVDVCNYVMLELGQPMHGFDLQTLNGGIIVRMAKEGECIGLLNGSTVVLKANTLLIADHGKACAIAGIMGGAETAVSSLTRDVLLESAFFSPDAIAGRARQYGLHTDSSHRFERGVDYQLQVQAIERATALLLNITDGQAGPLQIAEYTSSLPQIKSIQLRKSRIRRILGVHFDDYFVNDCLNRLGVKLNPNNEGWEAIPPGYRFDLSCEADLIEELARVKGYANIPRTLPVFAPSIQTNVAADKPAFNLDYLLINRGYQEAITYSFIDPRLEALLNPEYKALPLTNPISSEMSVMRTSLWPGLVSVLKYNLSRQQKRLQIYEKGLRFIPQPTNLKQETVISGLRFGDRSEEYWNSSSIPTDFYDIKGDVEALMDLCSGRAYRFEPCSHPALHPGQAARVMEGDCLIGYVGAIHPKIAKELELEGGLYMFELSLEAFKGKSLPRFKEISKFTRNRRDLSILVDSDVSWASIERLIRDSVPSCVQEIQLFDVYTEKTLTSGRKSIGIGLILQEISRTLTDSEMDAVIDQVLASLRENLGATLRE